MNFADRLLEAIDRKRNPSVIGLDSDFAKLPNSLKQDFRERFGSNFEAVGKCIFEFNRRIIDSIKDAVPAVKIQMAFYEQYGHKGMKAFEETVTYAKQRGLIVIEDAKRNDIGNTAKAYSSGHLGKVDLFGESVRSIDVDCITVNPYLGSDGVLPFLEDVKANEKGVFILVKTSNPSSNELQDLTSGNRKVYEILADYVNEWGSSMIGERGYSSVGAVVGATYPKEAAALRKIMSHSIFLVPGYGAQGGGVKDVIPCFNPDGQGALIHSARGVIFAYEKTGKENEFDVLARQAALRMKDDITLALKELKVGNW
ncbi:MAG: orotidine-5'-phosphate decarboxylase [Candidatus Aenigmarchaeota archaeon]|nr:orotidine-5'-phosphate decarboxylase [Candidatus Aenigmarchaeota archaeon]MCK4531259.1 orotidine-5'-phosphate decarboxylase [Candidatus Aenigmarchaeota archaeon]